MEWAACGFQRCNEETFEMEKDVALVSSIVSKSFQKPSAAGLFSPLSDFVRDRFTARNSASAASLQKVRPSDVTFRDYCVCPQEGHYDRQIFLKESEVGLVQYKIAREEASSILTITNIGIRKDYWNRGIARIVLEKLIAEHRPCVLKAQNVMASAEPFWTKCGFIAPEDTSDCCWIKKV
jgi:GNAT superfamily N-acetyltransferase